MRITALESTSKVTSVRESVLGMYVDVVDYIDVINFVAERMDRRESSYICVANVHMVMESYDSDQIRNAVNGAGLIVPDGMPLVWTLRTRGYRNASRVRGPTLVLELCEWASRSGARIGFVGGGTGVAQAVTAKLQSRFPNINIVLQLTPPFFTDVTVDKKIVAQINNASPSVVFIGLGCPKQELWMATHANRIQGVMVGVGNAFDIHADLVREAPAWVQRAGLEWLFRLAIEPRRLWRRYLIHNPRFIFHTVRGVIKQRES